MKELRDLKDLTMHDFHPVYLQLQVVPISGLSLKLDDGKKFGKSTEES